MLNRGQNRNFYSHYHRSESGQGFVEYALILILVAIVVAAVVNTMRPAIADVFSRFVERAAVAPPALLDYTPPPPPPPPPPGGGDPDPVCYSLTLTNNGPGDIIPNIPPNCDDEDQPDKYNEGTMVTLEAVASTGYAFGGWSQALAGHTNPDQIVMDGNKSVTATFLDESDCSAVDYTVVGNGAVTMDPPPNCGEGLYLTGTGVNFTAVPNIGYIFDMWSGDLTGSNQTVARLVDSDLTFTATFSERCYDVAVTIVGSGTVSPVPEGSCAGGGFPAGQEVTFTAVPQSTDHIFNGWTGSVTSSANPLILTINNDLDLTASFNQCHTLTRTANNGSIEINTTYNCSGNRFQAGTSVSLAAVPDVGYGFTEWDGIATGTNPITTITITGDNAVSATFTQCYALTTNALPTGSGGVNILTGYSAACNGNYFLPGTAVDIRPQPGSDYDFDSWSGAASGSNPEATVTMNSNQTVTANYVDRVVIDECNPTLPLFASINFQELDTTPPAGFLADEGRVFGNRDNGFSYGWLNSNTNNARTRGGSLPLEQRTFNHMQRNGSFTWEIAVPNGDFEVCIMVGDPDYYNSTYRINVEDRLVVDHNPDDENLFGLGFSAIAVTDGRLTVNNNANAENNKINWIRIYSDETFPEVCHSLTTTIDPNNDFGSVSADPEPNCVSEPGKYVAGTNVILTAEANPGYQFSNWSGAVFGNSLSTGLTVNFDAQVTASFMEEVCYTVVANVNPVGGGTVVLTEPNCQGEPGKYRSGTSVTFTATAADGYLFDGWTGDIVSDFSVVPRTIYEDTNVTANFSALAQNEVLLVVGNTNLSNGDTAINNQLQSMGYDVVTLAASQATTADADGKLLVFISHTAGANGGVFANTTVPLISSSRANFSALNLAGGTDDSNERDIAISNSAHPLAGGLSDSIRVTSNNNRINRVATSDLGADAIVIATHGSGGNLRNVLFAYETGGTMRNNNAAPARRVAFFMGEDNSAADLTSAGWTLFEAAVEWAIDN